MRVRIERQRQEATIKTGWFARKAIPEYCIYLTVHLREAERYLLRNTGIGGYVFFRAPIPPHVTDEDEIARLRAADYGLFFVRDLLRFDRTLIGIWPDLIAADEAETFVRHKFEEVAGWLERGGVAQDGVELFEL